MILGARLDSGSQVLSSISNQRALADSEALSNCATGGFQSFADQAMQTRRGREAERAATVPVTSV